MSNREWHMKGKRKKIKIRKSVNVRETKKCQIKLKDPSENEVIILMVRENVENCWNDEDFIEINRLSGNSKFLKFGKSISKILFLFCVYRNFFMESISINF